MHTLPESLTLPPRTLVRAGAAAKLLTEAAAFGHKGLLVHGQSLERAGVLRRVMEGRPAGLQVRVWRHPGGEPTLAQVQDLLAFARADMPDWVAAIGGGSVLDAAKAAAGLLHAPLPPAAYHDGEPLPPSRVPFLAVPSTAGTGSEATIVCVLTNERTGVKKSFRHSSLMASLVILDGDLLTHCPPSVIAASGMDAFTQAVESYASRGATWISDALALKAAALVHASLAAVFGGERGRNRDLLQGSYLAGLALSNARLGLVHGLAHPLGARYHQSHGLVCAVCLPLVLEFNRETMGPKYAQLSAAVGGDALGATHALLDALAIRSPFRGQPMPDREGIVRETLASGSTAANPRSVTVEDVGRLLDALFEGTATRV